ncbi:hypothetical protein D9M71_776620 [compost metagenome]
MIGDQQVVSAVLFKVQLVVVFDLGHFGGVAGAVLVQPCHLRDVLLGQVGAVAVTVLVDHRGLAGAELATGLVAFPVAGQHLVAGAVGGDFQHMVVAGLVGEADVAVT